MQIVVWDMQEIHRRCLTGLSSCLTSASLYFELDTCSLYMVTFPENKKGAEAQNAKPTIRSCARRMLRLLTFLLTSASFVFQDRCMTLIIII